MTNYSTGPGPGSPPPVGGGPAPAPGGSGQNGFFLAIRRMGITRSQDRWVGGVAGGLAQRTGLDPLLVRGLVAVSMLLGFGLVLYGVAWALLPEPDGRIHLEQMLHGDFDGALVGAVVLVLIGFTSGDWWFSWGPFDRGWFAGLAWAAVAVAAIVIAANLHRNRRPGGQQLPPRPPYPEGQVPMSEPSQPGPAAPAGPAQPRPTTAGPYGAPVGAPPTTARPAYPAAGTPAGPPASSAPAWQQQPVRPQPPYGPPYPRATAVPVPPAPPAPPKPPKPVKPQAPGPGSAVTGVVVGLILIGLATLLILDRLDVYTGPMTSVVIGSAIVLVGLAIILCGLLGRRAGGLTALAIIGFVLAGPAVAADSDGDWVWDGDREMRVISDDTVQVTTRGAAEAGFAVGLGSTTIDLTDVPLTDDTLDVPVQTGLGDVTVIVPKDIPVEASVRSGGGDVSWEVDDGVQRTSGVAHNRTFTSDEMADDVDAQISLQIDIGLGNVTIEEN